MFRQNGEALSATSGIWGIRVGATPPTLPSPRKAGGRVVPVLPSPRLCGGRAGWGEGPRQNPLARPFLFIMEIPFMFRRCSWLFILILVTGCGKEKPAEPKV